jgi:hypothetical protein
MLQYRYVFDEDGVLYHVYAPSKVQAIKDYLEEKGLKALPSNITITRYND